MLLIDGYNLLHTVQNILEQSAEITDVQLCKILDEFIYRTKGKGSIIFDGIGPRDKSGFANLFNLEVVFSGMNREADDVIEKLILQNTAPKHLSVISSDRRIKKAAQKRKANAVDCVDFWTDMLKQMDKKTKKPTEPKEKLFGVSSAETEYWLREFGFIK
ncbi:MAG: NYN domain-containing protein [Planctomycetaceae bacterium]|nr:NYN domain-containing protein [Planctomycetaceae bacterium]